MEINMKLSVVVFLIIFGSFACAMEEMHPSARQATTSTIEEKESNDGQDIEMSESLRATELLSSNNALLQRVQANAELNKLFEASLRIVIQKEDLEAIAQWSENGIDPEIQNKLISKALILSMLAAHKQTRGINKQLHQKPEDDPCVTILSIGSLALVGTCFLGTIAWGLGLYCWLHCDHEKNG